MLTGERKKTGDAGISPVERLNALVATDMQAADRLIHKGMGSTVLLIPDLARHLIDSMASGFGPC